MRGVVASVKPALDIKLLLMLTCHGPYNDMFYSHIACHVVNV